MQRGATVDAHGLCSFLKLLVAGFVVLFVIVVFWLSVTAPGGPLLLLILAATARLAVTLLAGPLSTIWALILVPPLILSPLLFSEELDLSAVLESMALGAMDLAVSLVGVSRLLGSRQGLACDTLGNLLAGVICLGFLCGAGVFGSLDGKHGFYFALPVAAPAFLRRGSSILI